MSIIYDKQWINYCGLKLYAGDTVLYQLGINCNEAEERLQTSVNMFTRWCSVNALTINIKQLK